MWDKEKQALELKKNTLIDEIESKKRELKRNPFKRKEIKYKIIELERDLQSCTDEIESKYTKKYTEKEMFLFSNLTYDQKQLLNTYFEAINDGISVKNKIRDLEYDAKTSEPNSYEGWYKWEEAFKKMFEEKASSLEDFEKVKDILLKDEHYMKNLGNNLTLENYKEILKEWTPEDLRLADYALYWIVRQAEKEVKGESTLHMEEFVQSTIHSKSFEMISSQSKFNGDDIATDEDVDKDRKEAKVQEHIDLENLSLEELQELINSNDETIKSNDIPERDILIYIIKRQRERIMQQETEISELQREGKEHE